MTRHKKNPEEYLKEPYARVITPDEESGTYTAEVLEFPGCVAQGNTVEEAYKNLEEAAKSWVLAALDMGQDIPKPSRSHGYNGKFALRLPRGLHRTAAEFAERESTSLNQFIVAAVAEKVGAQTLYDRLARNLENRLSSAATTLMYRILPGMRMQPEQAGTADVSPLKVHAFIPMEVH
jgi:predicted RNase H-like HicB family nuclease